MLLLCGIIIGILSIVLLLTFGLLIKCRNYKNEGFCGTCQGLDKKVCTDPKKLNELYSSGKLTENSNLKKYKGW
tara:strand:+ start:762 stop:983 length:222 start_codon:yes stop_codon:yes gene_type:complete